MKIVQINSVFSKGSTGKICKSINELLNEEGIENYIFFSTGNTNEKGCIKYSSAIEVKINAFFSYIFGNYGFNAIFATKKLLKAIKRINPDIIHLHNIHGHNINLSIFFNFIKNSNIKVYWTFHDCWAFTAYCPHYTLAKCVKWKKKCYACPQLRDYSMICDKSQKIFYKKKELFSQLDMTIITPSHWLANNVKQSFLKQYPIKVINNGIDLSIFYRKESNFRELHHLNDKFVILGVSFDWGIRKGLDVFFILSRILPNNYKIVLVGTTPSIDKIVPSNIISIHRTQSQTELSEIYSAANLFVNPTREDTFPTVNIESLACGTPVLTFDIGGSPEMIDNTCGSVVPVDDIDGLVKEIIRIEKEQPYSKQDCIKKASFYEMKQRYKEYVELYLEKDSNK